MSRRSNYDKASRSYEQFHHEQMQNPEYARAYEEMQPEFDLIKQIISLRSKRNLTQTELAERAGVPQSSISRLESRGHTRDLRFLQKIARALAAHLEIRIAAREENLLGVRIDLPRSLCEQAAKIAEQEGTTLEEFIAVSVAEKIGEMKTSSSWFPIRSWLLERPALTTSAMRWNPTRPESGIWSLFSEFGRCTAFNKETTVLTSRIAERVKESTRDHA